MEINNISLRDFRNYEEAAVSFDGGINVISGKNAQGKTNLLEAVCVAAVGHSFRTRFDRELVRFGAGFAGVRAKAFGGGRSHEIDVAIALGRPKRILRNGVRCTASELGGTLRVVMFSPEDLGIIRGGAAARRRLLDGAICQLRPGYAKLLSDYNKLLESKTRILRDYPEGSMREALGEYSEMMCRVGAQLMRYRSSFCLRLAEAAAKIHAEFAKGETLSIKYSTVSTVRDSAASVSEIYSALCEHMQTHAQAESAAKTCLSGVHRDDLNIEINGLASRMFASQGQTRTAALSLKLAECELFLSDTGERPVLLLDDVLSELDAQRQDFVLNKIGGGQTLITCCEDSHIAERTGGRVIFVEDGKIW